MYDDLENERNKLELAIEKAKNEIETIEINIENYKKKCEEINTYLEENRNTEAMQMRYKQLRIVQASQADRSITNYKMLVNDFSDQAYMLFAQPMIDATLGMVKSVAGERRDIPHMRQSSIDYIIKNGKCICGNSILPGSHEMECLLEQKRYLPPADMGSLLGEFEKTSIRWKNKVGDAEKELRETAQKVEDSIRDYNDTCNEVVRLEQKMDEQIDFAEKKRMLRSYQNELQELSNKKGELQGQITSNKKRIVLIEDTMRSQEAKNEENKKWRNRIEMAEELYNSMKRDFDEKEKEIFRELNRQIQYNFEKMFNAKDKKIELTEQYAIQMLYKTQIGFREEKNLSEGEKIARNFAFIVTILEYSRKKKAEKTKKDASVGDTLPIVLDGPFSKLGDENIRLIASVLPKVSEQVIIFMLRKDWEYTGLDDYVGASYCIEKEADKAYASLRSMEVK